MPVPITLPEKSVTGSNAIDAAKGLTMQCFTMEPDKSTLADHNDASR